MMQVKVADSLATSTLIFTHDKENMAMLPTSLFSQDICTRMAPGDIQPQP